MPESKTVGLPIWDREVTKAAEDFHESHPESSEVFDDYGDFMRWLDGDTVQTA